MSTIADVAARAGVSKATASRALSGRGYVSQETRRRVTDAAGELAYVAHSSATSLATGRTNAVGVIAPPLGRWFFAELITGIHEALLDGGYDLTLYAVSDGQSSRSRIFDEVLPRRRFDGIIAVGLEPSIQELQRLSTIGCPVVSVGPNDHRTSTVSIDDIAAGRIATEHLIDLGHRDIVFLGGEEPPAELDSGDARRLEGYRQAMLAAGLGDRIGVVSAAPTMPSGYQAAVDLLGDRRTRPTALVAVCDEAAIGAVIAARRLAIAVPTELSVVGIDDHQHAEMFALTTIRQQPREQGAAAVAQLFRRMEDADAETEHILAPSALVVRNSTSVPR